MNTANHKSHQNEGSWEHIGRAAESFARRVARDAGKFAERLEEHASEFAHELSHEWRHAHRHVRAAGGASADDVRRVLDNVRGVLEDILDGVDELIGRVFQGSGTRPEPRDSAEPVWMRMVSNRVVLCSSCGRNIEAGEEAFFRQGAEGVAFRCLACGIPTPEASPH